MNLKNFLENHIRGWLPKKNALSSPQRIRTTDTKNHNVHIIAVISVGVVATALLLAAAFPNPPKTLKQNLYQKTFTDYPYELVSLDVIILYETETDGTWSSYGMNPWAGGLPTTAYNITVLVKLNHINESMVSHLNVLDRLIGADGSLLNWIYQVPEASSDVGTSLMGFWLNRSAWCALSTLCYPDLFDSAGRPRESTNINYHFSFGEIQTNGTRYIFGVGDIISVPVSK